ncbi:hypothetical protein AMJ49_05050 [Parcubacteria bacterium DG_74_2]|nr:MAG: hypothetical protein AMJ49_05050 [Parcubacteria bacterium DG_74_2]
MAIIKIKEILGTSPNSFDEALQNAVSHACTEKQNVTGADILRQTVAIEEGKITEYKVDVKVAYLWEK